MLSVSDIAKLTKVFATKQDLADLREEVATKDELRQVVTALDGVLQEVKAVREEQSAHFQQHEDIDQKLKTQSGRLTKIESIPVIAHEIRKK